MGLDPASAPIIVFGMARSGTTYLVQLLNSHPEVCVSNETRVFAWAHEALQMTSNKRLVNNDAAAFQQHLTAVLPGFLRTFFLEMNPRARYWGDKNPHYASPSNQGCLETILSLFPAAKFIHLVRDGRDVAASGLRGVWGDFDRMHLMWNRHVEIGRAFMQTVPAGQVMEIKYEELVRDDFAMAAKMFSFLGIPLHPEIEVFCLKQSRERTPFCKPARDLSKGPAHSDWSSFFDAAQQQRSLQLIGDNLVRFGYETPSSLNRLMNR